MDDIRVYTYTPEMTNFVTVPKSSHTREKIIKIGRTLLKVAKKKDFCLYHCPGFNSRVYFNENIDFDTIKRVVNLNTKT